MESHNHWAHSLNRIISDNCSGSGTLLLKLSMGIKRVARNEKFIEKRKFLKYWNPLHDKFYPFAAVIHFIEHINIFASNQPKIFDSTILIDAISGYENYRRNTVRNSSKKFLKEIKMHGKNILLHSNSSAIADIFKRAAGAGYIRDIHIFQTVSYPAMEGIRQAKKLAGMGYDVTLFSESDAPRFIDEIDFAIAGADCVMDDYFINKTGTYLIAMLMKKVNKPFYVVADHTKIFNGKSRQHQFLRSLSRNEKPATEILKKQHDGISAKNFYFEAVPKKMVNGFFY